VGSNKFCFFLSQFFSKYIFRDPQIFFFVLCFKVCTIQPILFGISKSKYSFLYVELFCIMNIKLPKYINMWRRNMEADQDQLILKVFPLTCFNISLYFDPPYCYSTSSCSRDHVYTSICMCIVVVCAGLL